MVWWQRRFSQADRCFDAALGTAPQALEVKMLKVRMRRRRMMMMIMIMIMMVVVVVVVVGSTGPRHRRPRHSRSRCG
jgi:t-SNARE complex subunit (syntaxin)